MDEDLTILCTRPLSNELIEEAAGKGISIICEPFIITEAVDELEVQQEAEVVSMLEAVVVFTSARSVEVVSNMVSVDPAGWKVFCIGHSTREAVEKYFPGAEIVAIADEGNDLAEKIIENGAEEVFFFCGNKRLDTIPAKLKEHDILFTEIVVYRTIEVPHKISFNYAGVMFFSPSAARSFFEKNKPLAGVICFCIGNTTADEVRKFTGNKIITAALPTAQELTGEVIDFFT